MSTMVVTALVTTEVDVDLEGDLLFALDEERPALLRLEGDVSVERRMERSGGPRSFEVNVTQEGDYSHSSFASSCGSLSRVARSSVACTSARSRSHAARVSRWFGVGP